jgi:hypothetical protein
MCGKCGRRNRWHVPLYSALLSISMLIVVGTATAQGRNAGELRGTVVDSSGAVVPGAEVTAKELSTGLSVKSVTDSSGFYDMPYLEAGHYSVSFDKKGFKTFVQSDVLLHVDTVTVNATLGVGDVDEHVTVNTVPPLLETESPQLNTVLSSQDVTELPVLGAGGSSGGWQYLLTLMPGVAPARGNNQTISANRDSFNGSQLFTSSWLIDGGAAMLPVSYNPDRMIVPSEAIGEIDAVTQGFGADTGNGLSSFNVITKSGTNQLHGSLWEYNQNTFLNAPAKDWTSVPIVKTPTHFNEFGGTVGGPIVKNRLFFFFGFQRLLQNSRTGPTLYTFPTDAERAGNFAGLNTIYDPNTTVGTGNAATRTAFLNNQLTRLDAVAQAIQKFFPEPNIPNVTTNNYYFVAPAPARQNWYDWKVDGNLSPRNHLYTSGLVTDQNVHTPSPDAPIDASDAHYLEMSSQLTDVWTLSATKVNEFRASFTREGETALPESLNLNYPAQIGLPQLPFNLFPQIAASGGDVPINTIGNSQSYTRLAEDNITLSDSFTWIHGAHTVKGGFEYDNWTDNLFSPPNGSPAGIFTFNGIGTKQPNSPTGTGIGYADFLLGYTEGWNATLSIEPGLRIHNEQYYIQDFYKPFSNLTLNAGIRLIQQDGWREEHDRISLYDPTLTNPATGNLGALGYAGNQIPEAIRASHLFAAPRVGFAWAVHGTTSVRGGFGLYPLPWAGNASINIGPALNPVSGGVGSGWAAQGSEVSPNNITDVFQLSSGPPTLVAPTAETRTPTLLNGQNVLYIPYNAPMTYAEMYQLSVQHEVGKYLFDATYVGTVTRHLSFASDINAAVPSATALPRPNPTYQSILATQYTGTANYSALQLTGHREMSHGFSFLVHYTWAKGLDTGTGTGGNGGASDYYQDAYHPAANYAASGADIRNVTNGTVLYQLPFGKGRKFLNKGSLVDAVLGGWQWSTTYTYRSGLPFTPVMSGANGSNTLANGASWYPNRIGSGKLAHPTVAEWFNTAAFVAPTAGTFGDSRRNILYGPHFANFDMSVGKTFALSQTHDAWKLQFKLDMFDAFNHPNYGQPNASIGSGATVGTITSNITNRQIQLAAVLRF